jgi:hypothetical protein
MDLLKRRQTHSRNTSQLLSHCSPPILAVLGLDQTTVSTLAQLYGGILRMSSDGKDQASLP